MDIFPTSVVIIDDHRMHLEMLSNALKNCPLEIFMAQDPSEGLDLIFRRHPQIVITDLVMPAMNGLEILDRVVEFDPSIDVIVMTGHDSSESAVDAIRRGATDYLTKPLEIKLLIERITKLIDVKRRRELVYAAEGEIPRALGFEEMIGRSPLMWEMFARIRRIAPHYRNVLIGGETGSGKELAARAVHNLSPARNGRFVTLNCSAVVETLFESELFGHVRGSFTGAVDDKTGFFEHADNGTLFLDEIGDMPLATQAKLLRALQNQEILRVGALTPRKVDVRVIAATHRDLRMEIEQKRFREDLYYRLSMVEIPMPSLASRKEDLPLLIRHFVRRFSEQYEKSICGLTRRAEIVLERYDWPGNVRELENTMGYACMMALDEWVDVHDLPKAFRSSLRSESPAEPTMPGAVLALEELEKRAIETALVEARGNQSSAARLLSIGRDALRYKIRKHGLDVGTQAKNPSTSFEARA